MMTMLLKQCLIDES